MGNQKGIALERQWTEGRIKQAYELARAGFSEAKMAEIMLVKLVTFVSWKKTNPKFLEALHKGKHLSNLKAIDALYKRAEGYDEQEEIVVYDRYKHGFVRTTKTVHIPPDSWAAAKIASLRMRDEGWSETQRIEINQNITNNVAISGLATEILDLIANKIKELPQNEEITEDIEFKDGGDEQLGD
jgi:hypothetical protein